MTEEGLEKGKVKSIKVSIGRSPEIKEMEQEKLQLALEKQELEQEFVQPIKERLAERLQEHGIDITPDEIESQSEMKRYIDVLKNLDEKQSRERTSSTAMGNALLTSEQYGKKSFDNEGDLLNKEFSSHAEMMSYLREMERSAKDESQREQAKEVLDRLTEKFAQSESERPSQFSMEYHGTLREMIENPEKASKKWKRR